MRGTVIGIVIGVVLGIMIGATVVAPGLNDARETAPPPDVPGSESLGLANGTAAPPPPATATARDGGLRIIAQVERRPTLGPMADRLADGPVDARLFEAGALVPATDTFQAVASGTVDAVLSTPEAWAPDDPVLQLLTSVPFGPEPQEMLAWYDHGGGRTLLETNMADLGVHALLCGATPAQGSGWFRKPVHRPEDLQGRTMQATGLGARVFATLGVHVLRLDAPAIRTGLQDDTLDGAVFGLPAVDADADLHRFARNYYLPGWHRPVTFYTLAINADVWNALPPARRQAVVRTCQANVRLTLSEADAQQFTALKDLGLAGVQIRSWPDPMMDAFADAWVTVRRDLAGQDADFAEIWESLDRFRRDYTIWRDLAHP